MLRKVYNKKIPKLSLNKFISALYAKIMQFFIRLCILHSFCKTFTGFNGKYNVQLNEFKTNFNMLVFFGKLPDHGEIFDQVCLEWLTTLREERLDFIVTLLVKSFHFGMIHSLLLSRNYLAEPVKILSDHFRNLLILYPAVNITKVIHAQIFARFDKGHIKSGHQFAV